MEFKSFGEIKRLTNIRMSITQKIHGTNAQIFIWPVSWIGDEPIGYHVQVGSRTRWIYPQDDNYGFAAWVEANKAEIIEKLGIGVHYGEWAGPGINSGEGLSERRFVLFNHEKFPPERPLPPQTVVVPVLYEGPLDSTKIDIAMEELKTQGSKLAPGFMRPEGVVININGTRYKKVFDPEETQWIKSSGVKNSNSKKPTIDYNYLCQPIRLEKLLSRDEVYLRNFPETLPSVVKAYVADLIKEEQITGTEDEVKAITKGASSQIFKFIKTSIEKRG